MNSDPLLIAFITPFFRRSSGGKNGKLFCRWFGIGAIILFIIFLIQLVSQ